MPVIKSPLLTVQEFAALAKMSVQNVHAKISAKKIKAVNYADDESIRGDWRIPVKEAERFLKKCGYDQAISYEIYSDDFLDALADRIAGRLGRGQ